MKRKVQEYFFYFMLYSILGWIYEVFLEEHEAFGRGKLLISLQFDKSVCNNQISLLLQNVSVWLLMRSGAFLPNHTSPTKR